MISKDEAIRGVPLFATCSKKELALVARIADRLTLPSGQALIREGSYGSEFFIILSGTADVLKGEEVIATIGPGDFCGEIASVERVPRTATVTTSSPVDVLVIRGAALSGLRDQLPGVDQAVLEQIARRHSADDARE